MEIESGNFNIEVGKRIKRLRLQHNYTREYLAEIADISPKFLYEVETGKKGCSSYVLYRITVALEAKSDYILLGEGNISDDSELTDLINMFSKEQVGTIRDIVKALYRVLHIQ